MVGCMVHKKHLLPALLLLSLHLLKDFTLLTSRHISFICCTPGANIAILPPAETGMTGWDIWCSGEARLWQNMSLKPFNWKLKSITINRVLQTTAYGPSSTHHWLMFYKYIFIGAQHIYSLPSCLWLPLCSNHRAELHGCSRDPVAQKNESICNLDCHRVCWPWYSSDNYQGETRHSKSGNHY